MVCCADNSKHSNSSNTSNLLANVKRVILPTHLHLSVKVEDVFTLLRLQKAIFVTHKIFQRSPTFSIQFLPLLLIFGY